MDQSSEPHRHTVLSAWLGLTALALVFAACAPPSAPLGQEQPQEVVRAFLEAQRTGKPDEAAAHWGFTTNAFKEQGGSQAEAALREDIRRKGEDGLPHAYTIGATETSPQHRDRVFVQVWLDRPQQGPASLYELLRTPDGWKIVGFLPAPSPPRQQP